MLSLTSQCLVEKLESKTLCSIFWEFTILLGCVRAKRLKTAVRSRGNIRILLWSQLNAFSSSVQGFISFGYD